MKKFDVTIERIVEVSKLGWPGPGEAADENGLGCNRSYMDLRGYSWKSAREVLQEEEELLHQLGEAGSDGIDDEFWDDLWENDRLPGLDLGVSAATAMLSAARCIPFTSCNGGCFEEEPHHELYPLVAFYSRPAQVPLLVEAAEEAEAGLHHSGEALVVYADDIDKMMAFARALSKRSSLFQKLKTNSSSTEAASKVEQPDQKQLAMDL